MKTLYDSIVFTPTSKQIEIINAIDCILHDDKRTRTDTVSWNYIYNFRTLNWAMPRCSGKTTLLNKLVDYFPNSFMLTHGPTLLKRNQSRELSNYHLGKLFDYVFVDELDIDLRTLTVFQPKLIVRLYTPK